LRSNWIAGVLLALLVAATYSPTLRNGFVWDDDRHIEQNPLLLAPHKLAALELIWTRLGDTPQYYPLTHTSFWLEYQLWGLHPAGYHAFSIFLHAISSVLLWLVLRELGLSFAWIIAAAWAVHPMQVESVAWATERKNTLSAVFYLAAMLCYLRAVCIKGDEAGKTAAIWGSFDRPRIGLLLLTVFLFLLAMFSKTVAATLPAALLVIGWWKRGYVSVRQAAWLVPMFLIGLAGGALTGWMEVHVVGASGPEWSSITKVQRIGIAARALWFYVSKLIWPTHYAFVYHRWPPGFSAAAGVFVIAVLATVEALLILQRRWGRGPAAAVLLFAGTLFPALGFADLYPMRYTFVADHYAYLASAAAVALLLEPALRCVDWLCARSGASPAYLASVVLLSILVLLTNFRCKLFVDADTLWATTLNEDPDSWISMTQLGVLAERRGDYTEAAGLFTSALQCDPDATETYMTLAGLLDKLGNPAAALEQCRAAIARRPFKIEPRWGAADILIELGRLDEARQMLNDLLKIAPRWEPARLELGRIDLQQNRYWDAEQQAQMALAQRPESFAAALLLADAWAASGRRDDAIGYYRRLLAADPGNPEVEEGLRRLTAPAAGSR
jgi:protein O-mannosyl-transferase